MKDSKSSKDKPSSKRRKQPRQPAGSEAAEQPASPGKVPALAAADHARLGRQLLSYVDALLSGPSGPRRNWAALKKLTACVTTASLPIGMQPQFDELKTTVAQHDEKSNPRSKDQARSKPAREDPVDENKQPSVPSRSPDDSPPDDSLPDDSLPDENIPDGRLPDDNLMDDDDNAE